LLMQPFLIFRQPAELVREWYPENRSWVNQ